MGQPIVVVDAFTNRPFTGNPAAVCLLDKVADETWMSLVAREMNLAETAFLVPEADGYRLRWLTPTVEVDLCGHATLAASHVLWGDGHVPLDHEIVYQTRSGRLTAKRVGDLIQLDFPADPVTEEHEIASTLQSALGVEIAFAGRGKFDYFVELADEHVLRSLMPDYASIARLIARGVIVTAKSSTAPYNFISRFFAPAAGVPEDPVTGSAHCTLAAYWAPKLGKTKMLGYQASPRGGEVHVELLGERVLLSGNTVTCWQGELRHLPT